MFTYEYYTITHYIYKREISSPLNRIKPVLHSIFFFQNDHKITTATYNSTPQIIMIVHLYNYIYLYIY